jgi:hypothetical protein
MRKRDVGALGVAVMDDRWWLGWQGEEGEEEGDGELMQPTTLWEAEITALDDEHILALEQSAEDL